MPKLILVGCIRFCILVALCLVASVPAHAYQLPDTGQNKCYDNTQEIPCPQSGQPFYGQDAQYHGPQPAYVDHGNGTVTDLNTGLMWQQGEDQNDCQPYVDCYTWQGAIDYCADLGLGGHSDWRLPTRMQLLSIVDHGRWDPTINTGYFPDCRSYGYWSSSTGAFNPDFAWLVDFYYGAAYWDPKGVSYYVRCARGGP